MMRVGIIGAGPAGLTAAYKLAQAGTKVEVFEAASYVGGMCRSVEMWSQKVDLGPHRFFTNNRQVNALWKEVVGADYRVVERQTRIFYGGKYFDYPLKISNVLGNLGPLTILQCIFSWATAQLKPAPRTGDRVTFEEWVVRRFGRKLYEMFFKSYTEKLWGIPCTQLDADFAAQRIKGFSLIGAITSAVAGARGKHKTLVDAFDYPKGGTGAVYERMAESIKAQGGDIHLATPVQQVETDGGKRVTGIRLVDGTVHHFDHVISTMPLTLMALKLPNLPASVAANLNGLNYRNTILIFLDVESTSLFPDQWVYVHEPSINAGRVTNFRNWVPELYGSEKSSVLAVEYWCNDDDPLWTKPEAELVKQAQAELRQVRLIGQAAVKDGMVIRVPRSYPVYSTGYRELLEPIVDYLKGFENLAPIGRYGAFKYNNQDHSIFMGIMAADNIVRSARHDLWSINTDYDEYQEASEREDD